MPGAYLGPLWLNLRFSLALTICESLALFFVSLWCVGSIEVFSMMVHCNGWKASMRAGRYLCFSNSRV